MNQGRPGALPLDPAKDKSLEPLSEGLFRRGAYEALVTVRVAPLLNNPLHKDFKGSAFNGVQGQSPWPSLVQPTPSHQRRGAQALGVGEDAEHAGAFA